MARPFPKKRSGKHTDQEKDAALASLIAERVEKMRTDDYDAALERYHTFRQTADDFPGVPKDKFKIKWMKIKPGVPTTWELEVIK